MTRTDQNPFTTVLLSRNVLAGSCQLIAWSLFRPSAWRQYTTALGLGPDFAVSDVMTTPHRRNANEWRLVGCAAVYWVVSASLIPAFDAVAIFYNVDMGAVPLLVCAILGCALAIGVSVAANLALIVALAMTTVIMAIVGPSDVSAGLPLGLTAGVFVSVVWSLVDGRARRPIVKWVAGLVLAMPTALVMLYMSMVVPTLVVSTVGLPLYGIYAFATTRPWRWVADLARSPTAMIVAFAAALISAGFGRWLGPRECQTVTGRSSVFVSCLALALLLLLVSAVFPGMTHSTVIGGVCTGVPLALGFMTITENSNRTGPTVARRGLAAVAIVVGAWAICMTLDQGIEAFRSSVGMPSSVVIGVTTTASALFAVGAVRQRRALSHAGARWSVAVLGWMLAIASELPILNVAASWKLLGSVEWTSTIVGVPLAAAAGIMCGVVIGPTALGRQSRFACASRFLWTAVAAILLADSITGLALLGRDLSLPSIGGVLKTVGFAALFGTVYFVAFALPFLLLSRVGGPRVAALVVAIEVIGWSVLVRPTLAETVKVRLASTLLGFLVGATQVWWRQLFLYAPFTVFNFILYQVDRRLRSPIWSALRWNSAFWDERRWLPVIRLRQHVSLVGAHNPDEGKAALAALARSDLRT